jgi:hypothetical protein
MLNANRFQLLTDGVEETRTQAGVVLRTALAIGGHASDAVWKVYKLRFRTRVQEFKKITPAMAQGQMRI